MVSVQSRKVNLVANSEVNTQRVLASWSEIVRVYRGQYGVHMDPRTAYQRCHELQYEQFKSAQGLVDAMRDYQLVLCDTNQVSRITILLLWHHDIL